jgi:hypothetical protein
LYPINKSEISIFCFELYLCAYKLIQLLSGYKRAPKIEEIIILKIVEPIPEF